MSNTVDDYKSNIEGLASSSRYHIKFTRTEFLSIFPNNEYKYLVSSVNVPGQEVRTNSMALWGMKKDIASSIDFDPITISFICDKDLKIRRAFEEWIDQIVNKSTFTVSYYKDYVCDMAITILNKALVPVREYKIREVYPTNLADISLGYEKVDEPMQFTVTFKYWDFEITNLLKDA
jgi:hypothetical protein